MAKRTWEEARQDKGENEQLRGTFASVLLIGAFILVSWIAILLLYLMR